MSQHRRPFTAMSMLQASQEAAIAAERLEYPDREAAARELQKANLYASWAILAQLQGRVGDQS